MLFDTILDTADAGTGPDVREIEVEWHQCHARAVRAKTTRGEVVGILLPLGLSLRHGMVLRARGGGAVARLIVRPSRVLVTGGLSPLDAARVALEAGSLHLPVELRPDHLRLPDEPAHRALLDRLGVAYAVATDVFQPERVTLLNAVTPDPAMTVEVRRPVVAG